MVPSRGYYNKALHCTALVPVRNSTSKENYLSCKMTFLSQKMAVDPQYADVRNRAYRVTDWVLICRESSSSGWLPELSGLQLEITKRQGSGERCFLI